MTIIRLSDDTLWLHSPVTLSAALATQIDALGTVAHLIAPNAHHYLHCQTWAERYPNARIFAAPGLMEKPAFKDCVSLGSEFLSPWASDIDEIFIDIGDFAESVFFHRCSRTLIVTDLMQNFESRRITSPLMRLILRAGGATGPVGAPSIDVRLAARKHRSALEAGVRAMLAFEPERIVLSHGRCFDRDAVQEIKRAFPALI